MLFLLDLLLFCETILQKQLYSQLSMSQKSIVKVYFIKTNVL